MKRYLSVDCGGTKTAFLLCGETGRAEASCTLGPANYMVIGKEAVFSVLREGTAAVCRQAGIREDEITAAFIAIAGFGDVPADVPVITGEVEALFPDFAAAVGNDTENALAGSLLGRQGIHAIAGTGAIGLGLDRKERYIRSGGWHHLFGGDEGSGFWIGSRLLQHFTRQADGREERTRLYDYVMEKYALACPEDILALVITRWKGERDKIAGFSKDAAALAEEGDPCALAIFRQAAGELALIVKGIARRGDFDLPVPVSYSGGVFKSMKYLEETLEKELADIPHELVRPQLEPVAGGILLACRKAGERVTDEMASNLRNPAPQEGREEAKK